MAKKSIPQRRPSAAETPIVVSGRWLVGALALVLALAALCSYAALCLLFYQGQWQLVLHPSQSVTATPAARGLRYEQVRFDVDGLGKPQLTGWWIPADTAKETTHTLLYLHDGSGSLSNTVDALATLHNLGVNLFAIDYRGFGASAHLAPHEATMLADADAAWTYLTGMLHLDGSAIDVYGTGTGAALAAELAAQHEPGTLILENPSETATRIYAQDGRTKILPLSLLSTERFDPSAALQRITAPKLFLGNARRTDELYQLAAKPKTLRQPLQAFLAASLK